MDFGYIAVVVIVILLSMTLHEVMHGFMAYLLGDTTARDEGRLTLNPLRHIDPFLTLILPVLLAIAQMPIFGGAKPVPYNPARVKYGDWGSALVALAGPFTNLLIAFVGFGVLVLGSEWFSPFGKLIAMTLISVNLGFFVFNMLPLPPLDGSRFFYALAPEFVRRGMEVIERYGVLVVFLVILVASPIITAFMRVSIEAILRIFAIIFGMPA